MKIAGTEQQFKDQAKSMGPHSTYRPKSGFVQNWTAAGSLSMFSDQTYSRAFVLHEEEALREKLIMQKVKDGVISEDEIRPFQLASEGKGGLKWGTLAQYLNETKGIKDIKTNDEIEASIRSDMQDLRKQAAKDMENPNWLGKLGQLVGPLHISVLDPIYLPTYAVGIGAMSKGAHILAQSVKVAGVEVGAEVAKQTMIYKWRQENYPDHNWKAAAAEVAWAAGVAGGLTATVGAVSVGLRSLVRRSMENAQKTYAGVQAIETTKETLDTLKQAPKGTPIGDAFEKVGNEEARLLNKNYSVSELDVDAVAQDAVADGAAEVDSAFDTLVAENPDAPSFTGRQLEVDGEMTAELSTAKLQDESFTEIMDEVSYLTDCAIAGLI